MRRHLLLLMVIVAACGGSGDTGPFPADAFGLAASSDLAVGEERLLVAVSDVDGTRLASPDVPVTVEVWPEGSEDRVQGEAGRFIWAVEGRSGLYAVTVEFDRSGLWMVRITPDGGPALEAFPVQVNARPATVAVGDDAPRSQTPTLADAPLSEITSDDDPEPDLYRMSVADAVTSGRPSVIVFATPAFCTTATCGPTLDGVAAMAPDHPGVNFVHVEVFTNLLDPANLVVAPAVMEWGLPTEPWVFVVDATGVVTARFEGVVTPEELTNALGE
ncbi:MAG: hypothetical protein QY307_05475 [Acidimicrobiia bacterium]|nr:MAG: hypothetical protein QY307_05475 [Acidimicrobiia bacterium]